MNESRSEFADHLNSHALHIWQLINQRYYANLLSAVAAEALRFGYAFESGSSYVEVPAPVHSALARRLIEAKLAELSPGISADDMEKEIDRRISDREGQAWLSLMLDALALRGITLQKVDSSSADGCIAESGCGHRGARPEGGEESTETSGRLTGGAAKHSHTLPRSAISDDGPELATIMLLTFFLMTVTGYFGLSGVFRLDSQFAVAELLFLRNFFGVVCIATGLYLGLTFLVWALGRLIDAINTLTIFITSRLP